MSEPHPGAIAGISSEQFAENARAIGEACGRSSEEAIREGLDRRPIGMAMTVSIAEQQRGHLRSQ